MYVLLPDLGNRFLEIFLPRQSKTHGVLREASVHIMHVLNV